MEPVVMEPYEAEVRHSETIVEPSGFTLVEENDVAFSLQLCREMHRLYGDYQDGSLSADDSVLAGLTVTMEMLAVLSRSVTEGMPSMRITVAAAQTREMLVVMFGRDPLDGPLAPNFRSYYRSIVDESAKALMQAATTPLPANWADAMLGAPHAAAPAGAMTGATAALEPGRMDGRHDRAGRSVLRRLFSRRV